MGKSKDGEEVAIEPYCPYFAAGMRLLDQRWTVTVLRTLVAGPMRFSDMSAAIPGITDSTLSKRLKELESGGLVTRIVHPTTPVRVEYRLSDMGTALGEVLLQLNGWALEWIDLPSDEPGIKKAQPG
ncbi:helix-turn-helix domain-containing protein [Mycobacterium sp. URHB0044]|uniref:winged helix-turn-helix transcriptional regulator n=1 Tax=Mycobacterium sp. URHB0044 TaxID=1380386 RepID=UPI000683F152|nr:helix-turn-helix domain-containing protein [Mycobacterium sp. URHB0044]